MFACRMAQCGIVLTVHLSRGAFGWMIERKLVEHWQYIRLRLVGLMGKKRAELNMRVEHHLNGKALRLDVLDMSMVA